MKTLFDNINKLVAFIVCASGFYLIYWVITGGYNDYLISKGDLILFLGLTIVFMGAFWFFAVENAKEASKLRSRLYQIIYKNLN
jgi:hypothetical protein